VVKVIEMTEPINLTFTYTEDEYTSAARFFYARTIHTKFNFFFGILALLSSFVGVLLTGDSIIWFFLMFTGFILLVFSYLAHFVTPRQHYRRNPKFREQYNLQFSEDGILYQSKGIESRLEWSLYSTVWETSGFYFLVYGKDMFTLIPKRVFNSSKQETSFRDMLKRKIDPNFKTYNLSEQRVKELESEYVPPQSTPDWR